ncbi:MULTISPECIES: hypothetical protein [Methylobacterium]|uniref:Uncharacterized protein n=1 Tax=Methylobacterium thuringiense TaxID=1003091 RepID=A0ABQ4TK70_9HYPH|nr:MULTISPECIES: hypothetical protein [Methylobacterium]GJE55311.1 hypothetical protein EKPJFOCH_1801 [Methylobacterium thuringiense]
MRDLAAPAKRFDRTVPQAGGIMTPRSLRASGTAMPASALSGAMPICRIHVPPQDAVPQPEKVRLSHYIVARRSAPHAANDNRRPRGAHAWHWAVGIAVVPTLTAVLAFAGLF